MEELIKKAFERIEMHWREDELLAMTNFHEIKDCLSIFRSNVFDDNGISANIKDGYITFDLAKLCERFDLDAKEMFK